jgi:hypothetical protein
MIFNDEKAHSIGSPHLPGFPVVLVPDYTTTTNLGLDCQLVPLKGSLGENIDTALLALLAATAFESLKRTLGASTLRLARVGDGDGAIKQGK